MGKRKNHHKKIIDNAVPALEADGYHVTVFHTHQKMPRQLRGVPDLYICKGGISWWVEIKPRYANYMRDQMSDAQWRWYHTRREDFGWSLRYAILENEYDLLDFIRPTEKQGDSSDMHIVVIDTYHRSRYENWRRGR